MKRIIRFCFDLAPDVADGHAVLLGDIRDGVLTLYTFKGGHRTPIGVTK